MIGVGRLGLAAMFFGAVLAAGGCNLRGHTAVRTAPTGYNVAIERTRSEQLLLNLVRLRYRDTPLFLAVASVSTSFEFTVSAGGAAALPESIGRSYGLVAGMEYVEKPTVTYTPLRGEQFVRQLMTPIDLNTVLLLYHSGWSVERLFRVGFQSANGLKNAPSASGPTPDRVPVYKDFREMTALLRALQKRGLLEMGHAPLAEGQKKPSVELRIAASALDSPEAARLYELLGLERGRADLLVTTSSGPLAKDRIAVIPRSLIGAFFYLSQSVEAPARDERAGRVTVSRDKQGRRFDWQEVTEGLMRIRSGALPPSNAYVAVHYRDSWFYIDDSDLNSKSTFSLQVQLFALQAGDIKATGPILTLPVAR